MRGPWGFHLGLKSDGEGSNKPDGATLCEIEFRASEINLNGPDFDMVSWVWEAPVSGR